VLTTDTQREGTHFRRDWLTPAQLGRRAFRVAVSDLAAMAAAPRYVLLSLGAPPALDAEWARRMVRALVTEARACGATLVGGNVHTDDALSLVVTVIGEPGGRTLLRSGARPGDRLWVTGKLGGAAAGVELLERGDGNGPLVAAYRQPPLRLDVARALARSGVVGAMIDGSDGLLRDLGHICRASRVSAALDLTAIPVAGALGAAASRKPGLRRAPLDYALAGGDDYELLFTTRGGAGEVRVRRICAKHDCVVSPIGAITHAARAPHVTDGEGRRLELDGYSHFKRRS
jgi:thiamine-monophosphate kinase